MEKDWTYYLLSTLGEILFSRDKNDAPDSRWPYYGKWSDLSDGFNQADQPYYLKYDLSPILLVNFSNYTVV